MTQPGGALDRMRAAAPLVYNITNFVAMGTMPNALLAAGASPALDAPARIDADALNAGAKTEAASRDPVARRDPRLA